MRATKNRSVILDGPLETLFRDFHRGAPFSPDNGTQGHRVYKRLLHKAVVLSTRLYLL